MAAQTAFFKHLTRGTRGWWIFSSVTGSRCSLVAQIRKRLFINWGRARLSGTRGIMSCQICEENEAIGNKFTWPSGASGGPAGEPLRAEALTPCLLPGDPRWGKKNAGRSFQGLFLHCADPPEVSASILLFYLQLLIISCEGVSYVQGQHLLKGREQTWSELPAEGPGWCYSLGPAPQEPASDKSMSKVQAR